MVLASFSAVLALRICGVGVGGLISSALCICGMGVGGLVSSALVGDGSSFRVSSVNGSDCVEVGGVCVVGIVAAGGGGGGARLALLSRRLRGDFDGGVAGFGTTYRKMAKIKWLCSIKHKSSH